MEQQRALIALEPFLALAKSATSPRAAADLIVLATSAPNTYVFAELLQTPNIQALRQSPEHAAHLALLEIFAWGIYTDYTNSASPLPTLSSAQTQKLLLLSLLPLLSSPQNASYAALLAALPPLQNSPAQLETLITTALHAGLLTGTLDPRAQRVVVHSLAPLRDVPPGGVPGMVAQLAAWEARCATVLSWIEEEADRVRAQAEERAVAQDRAARAFEAEVEAAGGGGEVRARRARRGSGAGDEMDVDLDGAGGSALAARGVKRRGPALVGKKARG